jgi:hypothetical protein
MSNELIIPNETICFDVHRLNDSLYVFFFYYYARPVISDPGQDIGSGRVKPPPSYRPGMKRGTVRALHDTK